MLFNRGVKNSNSCILPDPTDALLIHICHKLSHVINGIEEQFYREISLYVTQNGFSWKDFWGRAEKTGIMGFVWLVVERWKKTMNSDLVLPAAPSIYSWFLAYSNLFMRCKSSFARRVFFEVPFVRNVLMLAWHKCRNMVF
jgi:hypothetical protein